MIKIRGAAAALALAATLPSGCAGPAAPDVPAGCDPASAGVRWDEPATGSRLVRVTLFRDRARQSPEGEEVLSDPFTPSISGLRAPESWIPALATSLGAEIDRMVGTAEAKLTDGGYSLLSGGLDDTSNTDSLFWMGATTVSAAFTVACETPVTGAFTSWTETPVGGVTCGSRDEPDQELGRQARRYCPRTPAPRGSAPQGSGDAPGPAPSLRLPDGSVIPAATG